MGTKEKYADQKITKSIIQERIGKFDDFERVYGKGQRKPILDEYKMKDRNPSEFTTVDLRKAMTKYRGLMKKKTDKLREILGKCRKRNSDKLKLEYKKNHVSVSLLKRWTLVVGCLETTRQVYGQTQ